MRVRSVEIGDDQRQLVVHEKLFDFAMISVLGQHTTSRISVACSLFTPYRHQRRHTAASVGEVCRRHRRRRASTFAVSEQWPI
jgi:hypothetical protein